MFSTEGLNEHIAGVILFDETVHQATDDGIPFPQYLLSKGILPGVKADEGLVVIPFSEDEFGTQGLDNLAQRLAQYKKIGVRFAKWRAAYRVSDHSPSPLAIQDNSHALARYAAICQSQGIVPIVEPDVSNSKSLFSPQNCLSDTGFSPQPESETLRNRCRLETLHLL